MKNLFLHSCSHHAPSFDCRHYRAGHQFEKKNKDVISTIHTITICGISQQYCVIRIPYTRKMEILHSFIENGSSLTVAEILRRVSSKLDLDKYVIEKETGYE